MHNANWDNLRFVLAVVDHGSVSAAARALKVNHATVLRRVAAFEDAYGGSVFDKSVTGYTLLPDRDRLIDAVRDVENCVLSVQRLMQGVNTSLSGTVRVSSTDTLCQVVLPDIVADLHNRAPGLSIELLSSNSHLDFVRMQADVFVRPALALSEDMRGERAMDFVFRAYGLPDAPQKWLNLRGPLARSAAGKWLMEAKKDEATGAGSDSFLVLRRMAEKGMGLAILPSFVAEHGPELVHFAEEMPDLRVPIWVGAHADLRDVPRIRTVWKHILTALRKQPEA